MPNRNRNSEKDSDKKSSTGKKDNAGYKKLPDNPKNRPDESISTRDDTANGKYSRTGKRDEDIDNDNTRGGR